MIAPSLPMGVGFHAAGAMLSANCYAPQKYIKRWPWEIFWMTQAAWCWFLWPIIGAMATIPQLGQVLAEAPKDRMLVSFALGIAYGIGGTAFNLSIRYIGFSLTYAIAVGLSSVLGTLIPPIVRGEFAAILSRAGSEWVLSGVLAGTIGIALCGIAGHLKERDLDTRTGAHKDFSLARGLLLSLVAGILSAVYGFSLEVAAPLADLAEKHGAGIWKGNIAYIFSNTGAFLSALAYSLYLARKNKSFGELTALPGEPDGSSLKWNYLFALLTGTLWYGQFFFYNLGHVRLGSQYAFSSWAIHMIMLVLFSNLLGVMFKEWRSCRRRTHATVGFGLITLCLAVVQLTYGNYLGEKTYSANWDSLKTHPVPEWFADAKFGIYFHWGPYSVPAFHNEWYARNMYRPEMPDNKHHLATWGPLDKFGYKDFIPMFRAEHFNPDDWVDLFVRSGAKFAGPVAEHADGFSMWDSKLTKWNAAGMGPKRDVVGEMEKAVRKRGLKFIATFHHQWLWAWYPTFDKNVDASNPTWSGLYGPPVSKAAWDYTAKDELIPNAEFCRMWKAKVLEVIDHYHPDMLWFDSRLENIGEDYRRDFLAHYFNQAAGRGQNVLVTYKNKGLETGAGVLDLERGRMSKAMPFVWLNDDAISWKSWSYIEDDSFKSPLRLVQELVDIVSKNGNLLLDIGPKADGTIPQPVRDRLLELGKWLQLNGEAIYGTRPWEIFGEGPTEVPQGHFSEAKIKDFTPQDICFTKKGDVLYAIVMGWPEGPAIIHSLAKRKPIKKIELLGSKAELKWTQDENALTVQLPPEKPCDYAVVLKIT